MSSEKAKKKDENIISTRISLFSKKDNVIKDDNLDMFLSKHKYVCVKFHQSLNLRRQGTEEELQQTSR